ncbi:MAG TPA: TetR/AcrR family transcriptional regulator C-terminal domain-containing protein [Microlunatus sp.]|nr:TetR/AcrR family transcriptional regulator C-terminal domain-containing protein [Microlunatus sp.]
MSDQPSTGDPKPPTRVPLTRERVLETALRLVDAEGLDALSRRRLGQELGRDAMTLYRYAPDRAALLDGIVELVLDELVLPEDGLDWQTQLRRGAHSFRRLALAHPHVVGLIVTRPIATPLGQRPLGTLRPLERLLDMLTASGFSDPDALSVYRMYNGLLYGHVLNELEELVVDPDETDDLLRLGLQRLPRREFPKLRSLATALADYDGGAGLDLSLDVFFAGLDRYFPSSAPGRTTPDDPVRGQ